MTKNIELWADFETWLVENYKSNVSDLSWNSYVERSKEYNSQRLNRNVDFDKSKIRQGQRKE
jgi:hypothetical protein